MYRIDRREEVIREIEKYLTRVDGGRVYNTGNYDDTAREAVKRIQQNAGLLQSGAVDYPTFIELYKLYRKKSERDKIREGSPFGFNFPIKEGARGANIYYINELIAELLRHYKREARILRGERFSTQSMWGVRALADIFGLKSNGEIDEVFYQRLVDEKKAIDYFKRAKSYE